MSNGNRVDSVDGVHTVIICFAVNKGKEYLKYTVIKDLTITPF